MQHLSTQLPKWEQQRHQAIAYYQEHNFGQSLALSEENLRLAQQLADPFKEAMTLSDLGLVYGRLGQLSQAQGMFRKAQSIFQTLGDRSQEAAVLGNLAQTYTRLGQPQQALLLHHQVLLFRQSCRQSALPTFDPDYFWEQAKEAIALSNLGYTYHVCEHPQQALDYFEQALHLQKQLESLALEHFKSSDPMMLTLQVQTAKILNNMGAIYTDLRRYRQALETYQQALQLRQLTGDLFGEATTFNNLGLVYATLERPNQALLTYHQVLLLYRELSDRVGEASTLCNMGAAFHQLKQYKEAVEVYNHSLEIRRALGDHAGEIKVLSNLAMTYARWGRTSRAQIVLLRAKRLAAKIDHPSLLDWVQARINALGET